jgi:hypothetical protein
MSPADQFAGAMSRAHFKPRREKMFGAGRCVSLDRNAKARIMMLARALTHRSEKGKHYGVLTAKFVLVLEALLWSFHNAKSGRCFPSYERIAERAHCARSTVYEAIRALEACGILTWCNRIVRIREWGPDLFGRAQNRWRVIRTSNAYVFRDPQLAAYTANSSKSKFQTGTADQVFKLSSPDPNSGLNQALSRLGAGVNGEAKRSTGVQFAKTGPSSLP